MSDYTKGPWEFGPNYQDGDHTFDLFGPGGRQVIACASYENMWLSAYDKKTDTANAHLMAASPELLEAVMDLIPFVEHLQDDGPEGEGWQSAELMNAIEKALQAIAKATGAPQ